mmetsp:Transcript_110518/g.226076  ORF Transcript_110518/g.226076 Transcript_110518/m.226076 type:complete len:186 (+) Transcript_110518:2295-2852(+)
MVSEEARSNEREHYRTNKRAMRTHYMFLAGRRCGSTNEKRGPRPQPTVPFTPPGVLRWRKTERDGGAPARNIGLCCGSAVSFLVLGGDRSLSNRTLVERETQPASRATTKISLDSEPSYHADGPVRSGPPIDSWFVSDDIAIGEQKQKTIIFTITTSKSYNAFYRKETVVSLSTTQPKTVQNGPI